MLCPLPSLLFVFFHFMSTVYKRSHIGVVETSSDHQCEIDWYLHWSSLPLHLPSSQVENPRMDWDSILNGQICQTQEHPIFFLCWFCLRHGVSGVDSKCLLVCFGCTLGPRFRMYPWTFDPSCTSPSLCFDDDISGTATIMLAPLVLTCWLVRFGY